LEASDHTGLLLDQSLDMLLAFCQLGRGNTGGEEIKKLQEHARRYEDIGLPVVAKALGRILTAKDARSLRAPLLQSVYIIEQLRKRRAGLAWLKSQV
jgi:hypothetical protein